MSIQGIQAVLLTRKTEAGIVESTWRAPSLNCESLGSTVNFPNGSVTTVETISVKKGQPDPALFIIPAYPESSPPGVEH